MQYKYLMHHEIVFALKVHGHLAIKTIFQLLDRSKATFELSVVQQKLQSGNDTREESVMVC